MIPREVDFPALKIGAVRCNMVDKQVYAPVRPQKNEDTSFGYVKAQVIHGCNAAFRAPSRGSKDLVEMADGDGDIFCGWLGHVVPALLGELGVI